MHGNVDHSSPKSVVQLKAKLTLLQIILKCSFSLEVKSLGLPVAKISDKLKHFCLKVPLIVEKTQL